jgi:hypothetical protein
MLIRTACALSIQANIWKKIKVQYVPEIAQFLQAIQIKLAIKLAIYGLTLTSLS